MMKKYALIVAAGAGTRMQSEVPKQFLPLNGRPLFYYSVQTFFGKLRRYRNCFDISEEVSI
ncbi:MAG: 2-C-methyl-D-erythritol 4-phosphate cytidylyltransferase [Bacteroidetes bacterium]|nr:2-C-methyl-D-erythritol 4-phosphate cytidylyltransferase [Bacteroidota bacterium]